MNINEDNSLATETKEFINSAFNFAVNVTAIGLLVIINMGLISLNISLYFS